MAAVADAMFGFMSKRGNEPWTPNSLPAVVAYGVEAALAWHEGDEVLRSEGVLATEEEVITGAHQHRYERELEDQLDRVLRYVELRDGWITADDVDGQLELRNLALGVRLIAEVRKVRRGTK